jgi:hypothetical protein
MFHTTKFFCELSIGGIKLFKERYEKTISIKPGGRYDNSQCERHSYINLKQICKCVFIPSTYQQDGKTFIRIVDQEKEKVNL